MMIDTNVSVARMGMRGGETRARHAGALASVTAVGAGSGALTGEEKGMIAALQHLSVTMPEAGAAADTTTREELRSSRRLKSFARVAH
jgi:hypothetical protein